MFFGKTYSAQALSFFLCSLLCLVFVLNKVSEKQIEKKIKASISVDQDRVQFLDQDKNPKLLQTQHFETLDFPETKVLTHSSGRLVGFVNNFFVEFEAKALVKTAGSYIFTIESDDGFRLLMDGKKIAEFTSARKSEGSSLEVILTKGEHLIQFQYFQSSGDASAKLLYTPPLGSDALPLGIDSKAISFIAWP